MNYHPPSSQSSAASWGAITGTLSNQADLDAALGGKADIVGGSVIATAGTQITSSAINAQTGTSYTLLTSDNGKIVTLTNASSISLIIPTGLGAAFSCQIIQGGAGTVTITASGTTVNSYGSLLSLAGQYASASIVATVADTFIVAGNLT